MLGHKKIQISLLLAISVIGCSGKGLNISARKPFDSTKMVDSKIANATVAPMPKILPQTHFAAARLLEEQGEVAKAAMQYRKAIAVNHQFVGAYHRLGMLLSKQSQHEEAIQMFKKAVAIRPDEAVLRNNLGFELMFVERWSQAKAHFSKALELNPKMTRAHVNMGLVLSKLGEFDRALESFSAVLPEADAYYNLGLMYRGQKRYEDAANSFEHVLKCNPKFTAAKFQLAELVGFLESPEEKYANKKIDIDVQPAPELPVKIDRVAQKYDPTVDGVSSNKKIGDDVVVITLPAKEKSQAQDQTPSRKKMATTTETPQKIQPQESKKEKWENVFDDLANHYANVESDSADSETIENTFRQSNEKTPREDSRIDTLKSEVALAVPMPRISKITARRTRPELPHRDDPEFLQHDSILEDESDSEKEVVAMAGLSLDDPDDKPAVSANRPAVIPETLDWFRGKLSMVRNEIACLEEYNKMGGRMAQELAKPIKISKPSSTNRSVLVNDEKAKSESKARVNRSKPTTDASAPGAKTLIELFNAGDAEIPFSEFTGIFKYLFAAADATDHQPLRDQDEMIVEAIHKMEAQKLKAQEDAAQTQLVVNTKSPQDETREWMLKEFGPSANWLLQSESVQTAEAETDEVNENKKPTTIEKIIHSAKSLVMGMATP